MGVKKAKKKKKRVGLTLQFITNAEVSNLDSNERIKKILNIILENKIVIIQGKLNPEEETRLIGDTMVLIGKIKGFKGVELAVVEPNLKNLGFLGRVKRKIANRLTGENDVLTVIGPASVIKEITKNIEKVELMTK